MSLRTYVKKIMLVIVAISIFFAIINPFKFALAQDAPPPTSDQFNPTQSLLPPCGIGISRDSGTLGGCLVVGVYYLVLYPGAQVAYIGGSVFDYFIAFTLNSSSYAQADFIEKGWGILRDIANVSFIFILLYSAIRFILGLDTQTIRGNISRIILIALVINFSLFATRVIIDAGNIVARVFYENIVITNDTQAEESGYKTISQGLIGLVNPQRILSQAMFETASGGSASISNTSNTLGDTSTQSGPDIAFIIIVLLIGAFVNWLMGFIFLSTALFLIARTVGLWIMMITSPIAFLSLSIPSLAQKIPRFGFSSWLKETTSLSFLAVVFLFFLYLTVMFIGTMFGGLQNQFSGNDSFIYIIMSVIVPAGIVAALLLTAKKTAKEMSGQFGDLAVKGLKMAVIGALGTAGLALGATAGVAAVAGRQVVGRVAAGAASKANTKTARGRFVKKYGTALANQNFDARNIKIPKPATSTLRSGLSYATGGEVGAGDFRLTGVGKGSQRSYSKLFEERRKRKEEEAELYKQDKDTKQDTQATHAQENPDGTKQYVQTNVSDLSVNQAEKRVRDAEEAFNRKKEEVHVQENYDQIVDNKKDQEKEVEDRKKAKEEAKKALEKELKVTNDLTKTIQQLTDKIDQKQAEILSLEAIQRNGDPRLTDKINQKQAEILSLEARRNNGDPNVTQAMIDQAINTKNRLETEKVAKENATQLRIDHAINTKNRLETEKITKENDFQTAQNNVVTHQATMADAEQAVTDAKNDLATIDGLIKNIENQYLNEKNAVSQAQSVATAVKRKLEDNNKEILKKYAGHLDAFGDVTNPLNHQIPSNRAAAENIRNKS